MDMDIQMSGEPDGNEDTEISVDRMQMNRQVIEWEDRDSPTSSDSTEDVNSGSIKSPWHPYTVLCGDLVPWSCRTQKATEHGKL